MKNHRSDLISKNMTPEYRNKVLSMAQGELLKNKPARSFSHLWMSAPLTLAFLLIGIVSTNPDQTSLSLTNESSTVAMFNDFDSLEEMEITQNIDILEEL